MTPMSHTLQVERGLCSHGHQQSGKGQAQPGASVLAWELSQRVFTAGRGPLHHPDLLPYENQQCEC